MSSGLVRSSTFLLGHSAYSGVNAPARHSTYTAALRDLMTRGVPMRKAHRALKDALSGSHACAPTRFASCEVVAVLGAAVEHSTPATRFIREAAQRARNGGISEAAKHPELGLSFGYIGNIERWGDDRDWRIFTNRVDAPAYGRSVSYYLGDTKSLGDALSSLPFRWDAFVQRALTFDRR